MTRNNPRIEKLKTMISKKDNIAEYVLHLWQLEDVVRAFSKDEALAANQYLSDLMTMMHSEGVMESGHTQIAAVALQEMEELHTQLLDQDAMYRAAYLQLLPQLNILKSRSDNPSQSDIEMMLVFLYNIMLLRMKNKELSEETTIMQQQVSRLLQHLSKCYKQS